MTLFLIFENPKNSTSLQGLDFNFVSHPQPASPFWVGDRGIPHPGQSKRLPALADWLFAFSPILRLPEYETLLPSYLLESHHHNAGCRISALLSMISVSIVDLNRTVCNIHPSYYLSLYLSSHPSIHSAARDSFTDRLFRPRTLVLSAHLLAS